MTGGVVAGVSDGGGGGRGFPGSVSPATTEGVRVVRLREGTWGLNGGILTTKGEKKRGSGDMGVPRVEAHRSGRLEPGRPCQQICLWRLEQEMGVIGY